MLMGGWGGNGQRAERSSLKKKSATTTNNLLFSLSLHTLHTCTVAGKLAGASQPSNKGNNEQRTIELQPCLQDLRHTHLLVTHMERHGARVAHLCVHSVRATTVDGAQTVRLKVVFTFFFLPLVILSFLSKASLSPSLFSSLFSSLPLSLAFLILLPSMSITLQPWKLKLLSIPKAYPHSIKSCTHAIVKNIFFPRR